MSTAIFEWALENRKYLGPAYELLTYLGLDHELVVRRLIPQAVMVAKSDRRPAGRRVAVSDERKVWSSFPDPGQTLQLGVLRVLRQADETQGHVPGWHVVRYLASLVAFTVHKSALSVAAGIGGVLSNGSTAEILELYDLISPDPGQKDPRQVRRDRRQVRQHLGGTLRHLIQTDADGLPITTPCGRTPDDQVTRLLAKMIPWGTEHVPKQHEDYLRLIQGRVGPGARPSWDLAAAHILLDRANCFQVVSSWSPRLTGKFDPWLLPSAHPSVGKAAGRPWRPPSNPPRPPDDDELLAWISRFAMETRFDGD